MGGIQISVLRLYIGCVTLLLMLRLMRQPIRLALGDIHFWLASGALVANYILFHYGLERANAASAMVLENTAPFFVLIFLFVFSGTTVSRRDIFAACLAIIGVALTVSHDVEVGQFELVGDVFEIGAGLTWAVFLIASSRAMQAIDTTAERVNFLFGVVLVASLTMTPLLFLEFVPPAPEDIAPLLFLGVFATAGVYYFWNEAASELSTLAASLMFALSVAFTFVNAAIFLNAPITPLAALGASFIVAGVLLTAQPKATD